MLEEFHHLRHVSGPAPRGEDQSKGGLHFSPMSRSANEGYLLGTRGGLGSGHGFAAEV